MMNHRQENQPRVSRIKKRLASAIKLFLFDLQSKEVHIRD
jgi:hypothetical protein